MGKKFDSSLFGEVEIDRQEKDEQHAASITIQSKDNIEQKYKDFLVEEKLKEMGVNVTKAENGTYQIEGEGLTRKQRKELGNYISGLDNSDIETAKNEVTKREDAAYSKETATINAGVEQYKAEYLKKIEDEYKKHGVGDNDLKSLMEGESKTLDDKLAGIRPLNANMSESQKDNSLAHSINKELEELQKKDADGKSDLDKRIDNIDKQYKNIEKDITDINRPIESKEQLEAQKEQSEALAKAQAARDSGAKAGILPSLDAEAYKDINTRIKEGGNLEAGSGYTMYKDANDGILYTNAADQKNEVLAVQKNLKFLGYELGDTGANKDGIDGKFGTATDIAVKEFQKEHGLAETGKIDAATNRMMMFSVEEKYERLAISDGAVGNTELKKADILSDASTNAKNTRDVVDKTPLSVTEKNATNSLNVAIETLDLIYEKQQYDKAVANKSAPKELDAQKKDIEDHIKLADASIKDLGGIENVKEDVKKQLGKVAYELMDNANIKFADAGVNNSIESFAIPQLDGKQRG